MFTIITACLAGIEACPVSISITRAPGTLALAFQPAQLDNSRDRIRAAMRIDTRGLIVQASIDVGEMPGADLAIAVGLLIEQGKIPAHAVERTLVWGEVEPDGSVRAPAGSVIVADLARREGLRLLVPEHAIETMLIVPGVDVIGVRDLDDVVEVLSVEGRIYERKRKRDRGLGYREAPRSDAGTPDLADIGGLEIWIRRPASMRRSVWPRSRRRSSCSGCQPGSRAESIGAQRDLVGMPKKGEEVTIWEVLEFRPPGGPTEIRLISRKGRCTGKTIQLDANTADMPWRYYRPNEGIGGEAATVCYRKTFCVEGLTFTPEDARAAWTRTCEAAVERARLAYQEAVERLASVVIEASNG